MGKNFATISKELEIPQKNVVRWCQEHLDGKEFSARSVDPEVKEKISLWFKVFSKNNLIYFEEVQKRVIELVGENVIPGPSWLKKFLRSISDSKPAFLEDE